MQVNDSGLFWVSEVKPSKAKLKRDKPKPVWLSPNYLPGFEEAKAMQLNTFTDDELVTAAYAREKLIFDIECYPEYFLIAFKSEVSGKIIYFEKSKNTDFDIHKLYWVMTNFILIDFNGKNYDLPIAAIACNGGSCADMYSATEQIIIYGKRPSDVIRSFQAKKLPVDHIDLIELTALRPSLKKLSGRLHMPRMQELPFVPGSYLTDDQITVLRWYCINDLDNTDLLYQDLKPLIQLREKYGEKYGIDLRSHSDAQISETVTMNEITRITGTKFFAKPDIPPGTVYHYKIPSFIKFTTPLLNSVLDTVRESEFEVGPSGNIIMPSGLTKMKIRIGGSTYKMGIGGLHSSESTAGYAADENFVLIDRDVASYYPTIILNQGLYPQHLGNSYLIVYRGLVVARLAAKKVKDTVTADGLKVSINGGFGKLGSKYSNLYSPELLIQVTLTGQLCLLMLIERIELVGIPVVSGNTDGIVIKCPLTMRLKLDTIVAQWEQDTNFQTEETRYKALYSRDVNNYIAVKETGGYKVKGVYAEVGASSTPRTKNPANQICADAITALLCEGTPIEQTIRNCRDIRKFITVREVKGGAVKDGAYLGKVIRWYYANSVEGEIVYAMNGNKVPRSETAKPCMQLPSEFPDDVNHEWYEKEVRDNLILIGHTKGDLPTIEDEEDDEVTQDFLF